MRSILRAADLVWEDIWEDVYKRQEFTLYAEKTCENVVMRGETGTDGVLELRNLEVGKRYYMKETKAPEGYRIPVDLFEMCIRDRYYMMRFGYAPSKIYRLARQTFEGM